jgi:hypothetical protein
VDAAYRFLETIVDRLNVPRRIAEPVRRVVAILPRLESGRGGRFQRTSLYPVAREIADLYAAARGEEIPEPTGDEPSFTPEGEAGTSPTRRRRRRRRRPDGT